MDLLAILEASHYTADPAQVDPFVHKAENLLDAARDYMEAGLREDAVYALSFANQKHPLVNYYLAYLTGNHTYLQKAEALPNGYCFPNSLEDIAVLQYAIDSEEPSSNACYYLGCLYYDRFRYEDAAQCFRSCVQQRADHGKAWRNFSLYYFDKVGKSAEALDAMERALRYRPDDPRLLLEYQQLLKNTNAPIKQRLEVYDRYPELLKERDDCYLDKLTLLSQQGKYPEAIPMADTIRVTNSQNILGIAGAESTVLREGYELFWTYVIAGTTGRGFWTVQGLPKVTYDLGEIFRLTQMDITFHLTKNRDTYFDLLVSTDGINWTTVVADGVVSATKTQEPDLNHVNATVLQNASIPARYVQIVCRGNGSNKDVLTAWCGIQEITIYGENLHDVTVGQTTGGTVTADKETAAPGDLVTLVVTPGQAKVLDSISVTTGNTPVTLTKNPNGTYSFLQPGADVTICATFKDAEENPATSDLAPVEILLVTMVKCGFAVLTLSKIKKRFISA